MRTFCPATSLFTPAVTTVSPGSSPASTATESSRKAPAVTVRGREIAILRAMGFSGFTIVMAVLLEALALALLGGVLGGGLAWLMFDQYTVSTLGQNFSQVVFAFSVSLPLVLSALRWALVIGFIGGLLPALHAARLPLPAALRSR